MDTGHPGWLFRPRGFCMRKRPRSTNKAMSVMASTLANNGVCPLSGDRVFEEEHVTRDLEEKKSDGPFQHCLN